MDEIKSDVKNKFIPILSLFIFISATFIIFTNQKQKPSLVPSNIETKPNEIIKSKETVVNEKPILNKEDLVGIWQDIPIMASGWSNHYNFYPSGKYTLYFSEMDCTKRTLTESGFWQFDNSTSILTLTVKQRIKMEGGILNQTVGSTCEWQGGEKIVEAVKDNEKKIYKLSIPTDSFKFGEETINPNDIPWYKLAIFNNQPFWRFNDEVTGSEGDSFPEPTGF